MIKKDLRKRIYTSLVLLFLIFLIVSFSTVLVFCLIVLGVMSIIEFLSITKNIYKNKLYFLISNTIFAAFIFVFCFIFFFFSNFIHLKVILFILLIGCVASDIGGFIFGKIFKGPKLTKISPNKTYSGALGSILFTSLTMIGLVFNFTNDFNYLILILAILTSISCQIGDLFFSFLKRKAKIKDTGNIFPGHGGVLDRLDGIFFGLPIGFTTLVLFY